MIPFIGARAMDSIFLLSKESTLHLRGASRLCPEVCPDENSVEAGKEEEGRREGTTKEHFEVLEPCF